MSDEIELEESATYFKAMGRTLLEPKAVPEAALEDIPADAAAVVFPSSAETMAS